MAVHSTYLKRLGEQLHRLLAEGVTMIISSHGGRVSGRATFRDGTVRSAEGQDGLDLFQLLNGQVSYKRCGTCRETLPVSDFATHRGRPDGRAGLCRVCQHAEAQAPAPKG